MSEFRNIALGVVTLWPLAYGAWQGGAAKNPYLPEQAAAERADHRGEGYRWGKHGGAGSDADGLRWRSDNSFSRFHVSRYSQATAKDGGVVDLKPWLSMSALIASMEESLSAVPKAIPSLPFATALAKELHADGRLSMDKLPSGVLGVFRSGGGKQPDIVLSSKLERLHQKGVPLPWLSPILMHEVDHYINYLNGDKGGTHGTELRAMEAMGYYLIANRHELDAALKKAEAEGADREVIEYYKTLRKITRLMMQGRLGELVSLLYGTHGHDRTRP